VNGYLARLRTHGLNDQNESIVGQPDSYVGDSANTCRIAFCYTVQEKSWWLKVVGDVKEAVAASPNVEEVVAAFPWDTDRDGPTKGENIDWLPPQFSRCNVGSRRWPAPGRLGLAGPA
jgi:hypothetical protein